MTPNFNNRTLFHGDNLDFMRAMNSESVDLIATDPPFNKGRDFHATPDSLAAGASFQDRWSWEKDVHQEWVDQLTDDHPALMEAIESAMHAHSDGMGAYMCFMAVRLLAMRRILKPTGSIYLHCDPTASHYLKAVMDAIFGEKNFRNEIIWKRTSAHNRARRFGPVHDVILFYSRSDKYKWNRIYQTYDDNYVANFYKHNDERGKYRTGDLTGPGTREGSSGSAWRSYDPTTAGRHWELPPDRSLPEWFEWPDGYAQMNVQERLEVLDSQGLVYWPPKGKVPAFKRYLDAMGGMAAQDIIYDIPPVTSGSERIGYPTQKLLPLYERITKASSNEGDIVLDPFAGCATTCVAAERLNRQWAGIDIWDKAHEVVIKRLHDEVGLFGDVHYTRDLPVRTDEGDTAAPYLKVKRSIPEPPGARMSRADMYDILLSQQGTKCQGCDRKFDDARYLELDHNVPRSDGGINHISNRILLCGPCNRLKSNTYTLSGLRGENKKRGYMRNQL